MSIEREIGSMIRSLAQEKKDSVCAATVMSVKGNTCTVEREIDCKILENVSLNSSGGEEDCLIITPAENSQVLIATTDKHHWFVCQYSQIEKITLNVDNKDDRNMIVINSGKKIEINAADKVEINGGENGRLEISKEKKVTLSSEGEIEINAAKKIKLKSEENEEEYGGLIKIEKLHQKLQDLEKKFNQHTHTESNWSGTITGVGAASGTLTVPATLGTSDNFKSNDPSDYENENVTH